jgi:hypothetical protein
MSDLCRLIWSALIGLFRSRAALEAEVLILRHQLNVLRRKSPKRLAFGNIDRLVFAGLYRVAPGVLDALKIIKPQTVIRWHRAGFRTYWRWKSRPHGGRPKTPADIRQLIRDMSVSAPAISDLSWLNPTPHAIAVYASQPLSPAVTQHSLPSGRYPLLGSDFHRLDRTSLRLAHLFNHFIGQRQQIIGDFDAERLGDLDVDQ